MERIDEANRSSVALAHISGLAGYVVPFGGVIAPILMMMGAEDGSQEERAAKQALALNIFQINKNCASLAQDRVSIQIHQYAFTVQGKTTVS